MSYEAYLQHHLDQERERHRAAGAAISVAVGDKTYSAVSGRIGYGADDPPCTSETRFPVGCLIKPFTSVLIMMAEERGLLELDGVVRRYMPAFARDEDITLRHLLSHSSGVDDAYIDVDEFDELAARMAMLPQNFAPGDMFSYSNSGFALLAGVAENVWSARWEDLVTEQVLKPLGITDPFTAESKAESRADRACGKFGLPSIRRPRCYLPAGVPDITFTLADLIRLTRLYLDGSKGLITRRSLAMTLRPQVEAPDARPYFDRVGLGWMLGRSGQVSLRGASLGTNAFVVMVPRVRVAVAVACNINGKGHGPILRPLVDMVLAEFAGDTLGASAASIDASVTEAAFENYCGEYMTSFGGRENSFAVYEKSGRLMGRYMARSQITGRTQPTVDMPLDPIGDGRFTLLNRRGVPFHTVRFIPCANGKITHLSTGEAVYRRSACDTTPVEKGFDAVIHQPDQADRLRQDCE